VVIYDLQKNILFLSRDRLGIKPLYYYYNENRFIFGSEIKQIIEFVGTGDINKKMIFDFISFGSYGNSSEDTYFNNIKSLLPGHFIILDIKDYQFIIKEFWSLGKINAIKPNDEEKVYKQLKELLTDSIKLRLRSDVHVGTALSGGLDSSGIVGLLNLLYGQNGNRNKVFTLISDDELIEDPKFAKIITDHFNIDSYKSNFSKHSNLNDLFKFTWHQEHPLQNTSIFGSWYLYQFINKMGVKVILDGQGADELMGGYYSFPFKEYFFDLLRNKKISEYFYQVRKLAELRSCSRIRVHSELFKGLLVNVLKLNKDLYYSIKLNKVKIYIKADFFKQNKKYSHKIKDPLQKESLVFTSKMKANSYELIKYTNLPGILRQVDRNSMAASVESRLPFLDYRLVEFLYKLPFTYMFNNGYTKYAYRNSIKGIIPNEVLWRQSKEGFKMPEYKILMSNKEFVLSLFEDNKLDNVINTEKVVNLFKESMKEPKKYDNIIWRSMSYFIWKKTFSIDNV
jgi:asparagine synthase (glutamine-hydrolysing)